MVFRSMAPFPESCQARCLVFASVVPGFRFRLCCVQYPWQRLLLTSVIYKKLTLWLTPCSMFTQSQFCTCPTLEPLATGSFLVLCHPLVKWNQFCHSFYQHTAARNGASVVEEGCVASIVSAIPSRSDIVVLW